MTDTPAPTRADDLMTAVRGRAAADASDLLAHEPPALVAEVLWRSSPAAAVEILWAAPAAWRDPVLAATTDEHREQWTRHHAYPDGSVGRIMERPLAIFAPGFTVREAIERLREMVQRVFVAYGWVVDG